MRKFKHKLGSKAEWKRVRNEAKMNIVFLDIDGVLNSLNFLNFWEQKMQAEQTPYRFEDQIDPKGVRHLNDLLSAMSATCVLSSSWRRLVDLPEMMRILRKRGFQHDIIGATPDLSHKDRGERPLWRGDEIHAWLKDHPRNVRSFVILDDNKDMIPFMSRLIQTDPVCGLTHDNWIAAAALLEKPFDWRTAAECCPLCGDISVNGLECLNKEACGIRVLHKA